MKLKRTLLTALALTLPLAGAMAQATTAFTYQGRLNDGSQPASGSFDFRLGVFDASTQGNPVGNRVDVPGVVVSNGLFTLQFDPGHGVFDGSERWLQITVRSNGGSWSVLSPRQLLTPTPMALYAAQAGTAAAASMADIAATVSANAVGNAALQDNAVTSAKIADGSITAADLNAASFNAMFWKTAGNAGTTSATHYVGTSDNQPLELKVNGWRALRLEPQATGEVNVLFGHTSNWIAGAGSVIAGGGKEPAISFRFGQYTTNYRHQVVSASYSSIGGGIGNVVAADYSLIAGGLWNRLETNSAYSAISGGRSNAIAANAGASIIAGGMLNQVGGQSGQVSIGGGEANAIADLNLWATIGGGYRNSIGSSSDNCTIGGGGVNSIEADSYAATIAGGSLNKVGTNVSLAVIGGGSGNEIAANSSYATIPGGRQNAATNNSFAAGTRAKANHTGALVWADATDADLASTNANSITLRAAGGSRIFSTADASAGVFLAPGSGAWTAMSDRNGKENVASVDARGVLERVVALPVTTWNYKSQDAAVRHIGPMAQDFKAAFHLGECDTGITSIDADGVALAAIQGLNQKLEAMRAELEHRETENAELRARVDRLERALIALPRN